MYGGSERIVSFLTEELVRKGHQVTLFASGDSITEATLVPCCPCALRLDPAVRDINPHIMLLLDKVRKRADDFDILHFHIDLFHFPLFRLLAGRTLTTLHGRQDIADLKPFYSGFPEMPLVSISNQQRAPLPDANFIGTIYHGIPADLHRVSLAQGSYLAFLGRISPEKRPDRAIRIARAAQMPLKIAAKVDKVDEHYFQTEILPLLSGPGVEFIGEINEHEKTAFLGRAAALLFPIDWPEPFGLVMLEAMACGTPVLGFRCGSIPEVIDEGITGKIIESEEQATSALRELLLYDRGAVRRRFEERFVSTRMASDYVDVYTKLARTRDPVGEGRGPPTGQVRRERTNGYAPDVEVSTGRHERTHVLPAASA
jgi:glycosyltransferase involved in cell wall biosynthesis